MYLDKNIRKEKLNWKIADLFYKKFSLSYILKKAISFSSFPISILFSYILTILKLERFVFHNFLNCNIKLFSQKKNKFVFS